MKAKNGLRAASEKAWREGKVELEAYRSQSGRECRRLQEESARLRVELANLEG